MALQRGGPSSAAASSSSWSKDITQPLLGWTFKYWTTPKLRAMLDYFEYEIDESQGTASKLDLMAHLDRLIHEVGTTEMTVHVRDRVLHTAGLGAPPQYDPRLAEVARYIIKEDDEHDDGNLHAYPYVSEMLERGPPSTTSPLTSEYKAVAADYQIYLNAYSVGNIFTPDGIARVYRQAPRPQKTYSDQGRDSFIRFALYNSFLNPEELKAFITDDNNAKEKEEVIDEAASTAGGAFPTTPPLLDLKKRAQPSIVPPPEYISLEEYESATAHRPKKQGYISLEEYNSAATHRPAKKPEYIDLSLSSSSPSPAANPLSRPGEDSISPLDLNAPSHALGKRKRISPSPAEADADAEKGEEEAKARFTDACPTCHRSSRPTPTPDFFTSETRRRCPGCKEIIMVVKEKMHVPTICEFCPFLFCCLSPTLPLSSFPFCCSSCPFLLFSCPFLLFFLPFSAVSLQG